MQILNKPFTGITQTTIDLTYNNLPATATYRDTIDVYMLQRHTMALAMQLILRVAHHIGLLLEQKTATAFNTRVSRHA